MFRNRENVVKFWCVCSEVNYFRCFYLSFKAKHKLIALLKKERKGRRIKILKYNNKIRKKQELVKEDMIGKIEMVIMQDYTKKVVDSARIPRYCQARTR